MPRKFFRKRTRKNKGGKSRKQKMYSMKGCSKSKKISGGKGCGAFGCPIAPYTFKHKGGGCVGQCSVGGQTGGNFYKPPAPIPGPFVGESWTPSIRGWPGVNGIGSDNNYLAQNLYDNGDPQTMMKLGGSKRRKNTKKKYPAVKGGGIIPQDLVNLGRDMSFNFKSAYNALNGNVAPTNPLPYKDQLYKPSISNTNKLII
jgi:hypothetical protein